MARDRIVSIVTSRRERVAWLEWLKTEHAVYSDAKFDEQRPEHDERLREDGIGIESWWRLQVFQYVQRAHVLGLETPQGRQALAKGLAAYTGLLESTIRVHGPLPPAGVSSGTVPIEEAV